ncbi:NAD(P)-dependent oxidoreductase [Desulforamulus ruminis]|uniref:NAD-dependent epimerase/dehydratase n=1 Tax=Desulforamulus ruminis (strain ATCC 23193 / DSM 2154 / NCIMB 8452 / DL) TaxID=696281 RepID=F6DUT7_DESRL|nr:NAD(P)-dependent oxidoreductase [Desulforamulus ruminis]AEG60225.1 NAD-dependent epimerase/dehydratase [Desulforamulus ruminis DSM 2154]
MVTGAGGFIGRHLLKRLTGETVEIGALVRNKDPLSFMPTHKVSLLCGDLLDEVRLRKIIKEFSPDQVFHLAGVRPRGKTRKIVQQAYQGNLTATMNLLGCLQESSCRAIVLLGSTEEYGLGPGPFREDQPPCPVSAYGASKAAANQWALLNHRYFNDPISVVRPTLVYGPGQRNHLFLGQLMESLAQGQPFAMTAGEQKRDFLFVDDLVETLCLVAEKPETRGRVLNIGSGRSISIREVAEKVGCLMGRQSLLKIGALDYSPEDPFDYRVDISLAHRLLKWKPRTTLEEGLQKTIQWYQDNFKNM